MELKIDQKLTRLLGGSIPMEVIIGEIDDETIKVGSVDGIISYTDGWTFCKKTGVEIDERFKWGPKYGQTGSYIKEIVEENNIHSKKGKESVS